MNRRCLASIGALAAVIAVIAGELLAPGRVAGWTSLPSFVRVAEAFGEGAQAPTAAAKASTPAAPGTWTPSRTPWGEPDLQGIWSPGYHMTSLERPDKYAGREFLTDEEVAVLEKQAAAAPGRNARLQRGSLQDVEGAYNDAFTGRGKKVLPTRRTSLIVDPPDGKIPPLTPEGQKDAASSRRRRATATPAELAPATPYPVARDSGGPADGPEDRPSDTCRGVSLPFIRGTSGTFSRIVQTPGSVAMYYEDGHRGGIYRMVALDQRPHPPKQIRQWLGHSVGRWEGDTLVVDTTNFTDKTDFEGSRQNLHLIERYTRVAPDMIIYRVTIDDPTVFTRSWTIELPLTKSDDKANSIFEAACHEGNYAMTSILAGARALEREQAAKKKGSR